MAGGASGAGKKPEAKKQTKRKGVPVGTKKTPPRLTFVKMGAPRTTVKDLPENWQELMIKAAEEGASNVTLMVVLGIGHTAFNTLLADDINFQYTVERCKVLAQHWHERTGRGMMAGANGNAVAWKFAMQNQFGWRDRQQLIGDPTAPIGVEHSNKPKTKEELMAELAARGLPTTLLKD